MTSGIYTPTNSEILSNVAKINDGAVRDFLRPNGFRLLFQHIPAVAYTCQSVTLPSVTLGSAIQPTPGGIDLPHFGDKAAFGDLYIKFIVDENMANYIEMFDWMMALVYQENYQKYSRLSGDRLKRFPFVKKTRDDKAPPTSNAKLMILNSSNLPSIIINFVDIFPIELQPLDFDVTVETINYLTTTSIFKYRSFEIEQL